jgi:hypothetical protein
MESGAIRSSKKFSGSLLAVSGRLSTYSKRGVRGVGSRSPASLIYQRSLLVAIMIPGNRGSMLAAKASRHNRSLVR